MLPAENKEPAGGNSTGKFNELNVREKLFSSCKTASVGRILARTYTFTYTRSQIVSLFTNKLPKLAGRRPEVLTGSSQMNAARVTYFESRQIDFLSSHGEVWRIFCNESIAEAGEKDWTGWEGWTKCVHVVRFARVRDETGRCSPNKETWSPIPSDRQTCDTLLFQLSHDDLWKLWISRLCRIDCAIREHILRMTRISMWDLTLDTWNF